MLTVELLKPPRKDDVTLSNLPVHGAGKEEYIVDVYAVAEPAKLYRCWLRTDETEAEARTHVKQYPAAWENLWKEKFLKQKEELYPLEMIYKVTETDMSTAQKLYLIDLICKEQLADV